METSYGFRSRRRRQAAAGQRGVPPRRRPLRPDERPDVGRHAPAVEGRDGRLAQSAEARRAGRCSTWPAAPATSPSASSRRQHGNAHATVLDINGSMLAVGRERAEKLGLTGNVDFVEANAEELPFADDSFDAYTIAFGIRNVPRIEVALAEALSRAEARRPLPVPGILRGRHAAARPRLRGVVVQRHPAASASWSPATASPMPIWSNRSASSRTRQNFAAMMTARRLRAGDLAQLFRRHRRAAFGLEALTEASA